MTQTRLTEELERAWFGKIARKTPLLDDIPFYQGLFSAFLAKLQDKVRGITGLWAEGFQEEVEKQGYTYIGGRWGYESPDSNHPYGAVSAEFRVGTGIGDPTVALALLTKMVADRGKVWGVFVVGNAVVLKFYAPLDLR